MTPYYERNGIVLYHGDALELLSSIGANSIAAVVTDPPYMVAGSSTRRGDRPQSPIADWTNAARWYRDWLTEAMRVSCQSAPIWTFGNWRTLPVLEIAAQSLARRITSVLVWDKEWIGVGSMNGLRCSYELVFLFGGPEFAIADRTIADIWRERWASARPNGHPQEKPVRLLRRLLDVSGPGSVLDPFAGSGTTLVAAASLARRAIGMEIDERYCEIAAKRIEAEAFLAKDVPLPLDGAA